MTQNRKNRNIASNHISAGKAGCGIWPKSDDISLNVREIKFVDLIKETFSIDQKLNLLDAGCGNGYNFLSVLESLNSYPDIQVYMRDIQIDAIEEVNNRYPSLGSNIQVDSKCIDIARLDLPDNKIQGVFMKSVLGWLSNYAVIEETLGQLFRIIVQNGLVYTSVMTPFNLPSIYYSLEVEREDWRERVKEIESIVYTDGKENDKIYEVYNTRYDKKIHFFTKSALVSLFQAEGFQVIDAEYYRNKTYPNGLSDEYPENLYLIARKSATDN